ncbi:hypothetical protein SAMN05421866_3230 [Chryseobacterium oranimense]|uniref:Uncharacterized protein n=1 Tax=Chryseobacterium oranimense TaxID=421058 RepID=A0A1M5UH53_9FLAO|nr:hypothetical protein [Chryseobacterium oranimense]SHH62344.1 hypothetical protein SAMN05421866_3230 [Chryseobacterium oranimense]
MDYRENSEAEKKQFINKFIFFLDYIFEETKKVEYKYFSNLVLGISIVLEYKKHISTQLAFELIRKEEEKSNIFLTDLHRSNYVSFYSDFVADFDPDGYWSDYPNIWKEEIPILDDYLNQFEFVKNQNLQNEFKAKIEQFNILYINSQEV